MISQEQKPNQPILDIIQRVSGNNYFQYRMFAVFMIQWVVAALILFSLNFFYYVPDFVCSSEEMIGFDTCEDFVCSIDHQGDEQSQKFWYQHLKKPIPPSISLDYGVIMLCSQAWLISLLQSMSYIGSLVGFISMPMIADNWGRKSTEIVAWSICIVGQLLLLMSFQNLALVGIGSFLMGFGANVAITLHYSFIKELIVNKIGQRMIIFLQVGFSFGVFLIAMLSWLVWQWKLILALGVMIPSIMILGLGWNWIEETPEFLLIKGGKKALLKVLNKIAKLNKVCGQGQDMITLQDLNNSTDSNNEIQILPETETIVQAQCQIEPQSHKQQVLSFIDLFRYKSLLKITLLCAWINFIIEFTYDGTILSLDKIGVSVYLNQMLVGLVQMFAAVLGGYIVPKVKRKRFLQVAFFVIAGLTAGLGVFTLIDKGDSDSFTVLNFLQLLILGCLRITLNITWGIFFVFVAEMYPAEITSISFGWVSIVGTVGASISPYIQLTTAQFTLFFMAVLNFTNFFFVGMLKETKGRPIRLRIMEREQSQGVFKQNIQKNQPFNHSSRKDNNQDSSRSPNPSDQRSLQQSMISSQDGEE